MEAQLKTAIGDWRKARYEDRKAFKKELGSLYSNLLLAVQNPQKTSQTQTIKEFLSEESQLMDTCVRWHLLQLIISNAQGEAVTSDAKVQLATMIMESDKAGEFLLFELLSKLNKSCKWKSGGDKRAHVEQPKDTFAGAPSVSSTGSSRLTASYHLDANKTTDLFEEAVTTGFPRVNDLLAVAKSLIARNQSSKTLNALVRSNVEDLHAKIVFGGDAASKFEQVLVVEPEFVGPADGWLLNRIVTKPLLDLAKIILASEHHRALLTTQDYIVQALELWVLQPGDGDDESDSKGRKKGPRQDLVSKILSHAPEKVLQSPQVLTALMKDNLLEEDAILHAYASNESLQKALSDQKNSTTGRLPLFTTSSSTSSSASFPFAAYVENVSGILNMAVLYQQQPLVEALLRQKPLLAVSRSFVYIDGNGGTLPKREESKKNGDLRKNGESSKKGDSSKDDPSKKEAVADNAVTDEEVAGGRYPLWYNNETFKGQYVKNLDIQKWKKIRSALIYCTMKHADNVQTLLTILRDSEEPEREINFDMSRLLIEGTSVADFVTSMPRDAQSLSLIRYEETIRYAEFPSLDRSTLPEAPAAQNQQHSHREHTHTEVLDMLKWLHDHGVRRIITLRVPDRMAHPHDELEIAEVVRRFRVEKLDWRILDLSLNIFLPHGEMDDISLVCDANDKPNNDKKTVQPTYLTHLHLYTGGRRSALDHWFSAEGLQSTQLKHVYIHVIKELTTKEQSNATLKYIRIKVAELRQSKPSMEIEVKSNFWMAQTETPRLKEIIHHLSPRLAEFINYYHKKAEECHNNQSFRPTRVAIIDNGILSMDPANATGLQNSSTSTNTSTSNSYTDRSSDSSSERHLQSTDFLTTDSLWARVCEGRSFVHEQDRVSPWYLASNPHGTRMANLVCAIDPLCQLFVAKIADHQYGYSAAHAEEAVRWAISKDVDIISMSFTTTEDHAKFRKAVTDAMDLGILVVCSHHDEGASIGTEVFPVSLGGKHTDSMLRMASCNRYGKLETENASDDANKYDFCINSQDVTVDAIPFLASSTEHISGSSVATAIAAGVCSLLIACLRTLRVMDIAGESDKSDTGYKIRAMRVNVDRALSPNNSAGKGNRPAADDIKTFLQTMAPSTNNKHFITLDRFARLHELRDVNTLSLPGLFFNLGAKFGLKGFVAVKGQKQNFERIDRGLGDEFSAEWAKHGPFQGQVAALRALPVISATFWRLRDCSASRGAGGWHLGIHELQQDGQLAGASAKDSMGLISLLPEVIDAMAKSDIPVFAAGGIVDDRGVTASLCLGASGVVMGTRFLASREARISPGFQNEILRANNGAVSTTRTLLYNHLRGEYGWPEDYVPRTIINKSFVEFRQGRPFEELRELWQEAGDEEGLAWGPEGRRGQYVGASIGLIHEVRCAAEIVQDVRDKAVARIKSL